MSYPTTRPSVDGYTIAIADGSSVTATNAATGAVIVGTQLAAPTSLAATAGAPSTTVTWTDPAAGNVEVWRSTDGGATWALRSTVARGAQTYADSTTALGTYTYRLRTSSSTARSAYTSSVSTTVSALASVYSGASPLTTVFSWQPQAGATDYRLQVATEPTFASPIANLLTGSATPSYAPGPIGGPATLYARQRRETPTTGPWLSTVTIVIS